MTGKDVWEAYQKLPDEEKIKFNRIVVKSRQKMEEELEQKRKEIASDLMNVLDERGENYFSQEYIEKILKIKHD